MNAKTNLLKLPEEEAKRIFRLMAMRDEIDRLTHMENIPKEQGKRSRSHDENILFVEVARAYYGRREVFGMMAEQAAREGDEEFFRLAAKYLAKVKDKEANSEPFTRHVMWALVFVHNALVEGRPEPTKRELQELVRNQLKSRKITPMDISDYRWQNVWKASPFLRDLEQARPGSSAWEPPK